MAEPRPATGLLVGALIRRIEGAGGIGTVIASGDGGAGAILLLLSHRGVETALLERTLGRDGYVWSDAGPADPTGRANYIVRRRRTDPDLWVVELDHPEARTLALAMSG